MIITMCITVCQTLHIKIRSLSHRGVSWSVPASHEDPGVCCSPKPVSRWLAEQAHLLLLLCADPSYLLKDCSYELFLKESNTKLSNHLPH